MEFTLLFAALAGVAPLWLVASRTAEGAYGHSGKEWADTALGAAVVGLFAGRLVAMIGVGVNPLTAPADIIIVRGGVSTAGASVAALAFLAWTTRKLTTSGASAESPWTHRLGLTSALAPAALTGLAGWHAGCVFRDACMGTAAPWGRHATELYAAALFTIGALVVARLRRSKPGPVVVGTAMATAGAVRLGTEFLRPSLTGGPRALYAIGIAAGVAMILAGVAARRPARAVAADGTGDDSGRDSGGDSSSEPDSDSTA